MTEKSFPGERTGAAEVLLLFPEGDEDRPIIVGLMQDPLFDLVSIEVENVEENAEVPKEFRIDGRKVLIDAEEEVSIRCGKGASSCARTGKSSSREPTSCLGPQGPTGLRSKR